MGILLFFLDDFAGEVTFLGLADVFWDSAQIPLALSSLIPRVRVTVFCYGQSALHRRK